MKKTLTFKAVSIPQFDEFKKLHNQFILKKCPDCESLGKRTENIFKTIGNRIKSLSQISVPSTIEQVRRDIVEVLLPKFDEMNALYKEKCPNSKDFNIESILVLGNCEKKRHL